MHISNDRRGFSGCRTAERLLRLFRLRAWLAPLVAISWLSGVCGQPLNLELENVSAEGVRLRAANAAASHLTLEGSFDLQVWFPIQSLPAAAGGVEFLHSNPVPASTVFYRAREGAIPEQVRVIPQMNTNQAAAALITPEAGGKIRLELGDGLRFLFEAPAGAVREAVVARMTLITNFAAFPEHDGFRHAVMFEPEGLDFQQTARLTITFPADIPAPDMAAYSFDRDGSKFHLVAAKPAARQVIVPVDHFSGKGVANFQNSAPPTFGQAWTGQRDARRAAEDRHARRVRQAIRDEYSGKITESASDLNQQVSELDMIFEIFRNGVKPYLKAAESDCAIGRGVVAPELERLIARASRALGGPLGENDYLQTDLREIMPKIRCACARELIRRCEEDPGASGSELLAALNDLLLDSRGITGRTDAQGCELGSDDQIRNRLMSGPCFGEWEGSIVLERVTSITGSGQSGSRTGTWDDEKRELYTATVKGVSRRSTFTSGGKPGEGWTLDTEGLIHMGIRIDQRFVDDPPNWDIVTTTTETASAAEGLPSRGTITLRIIDGKLESLGADGGVGSPNVRYTVRSGASYRCKVPFPPNNPCPSPTEDATTRSSSTYQGYGVDATDPNGTFTSVPGRISATWRRVRETEQSFGPPQRVEERIQMSLIKRPNR